MHGLKGNFLSLMQEKQFIAVHAKACIDFPQQLLLHRLYRKQSLFKGRDLFIQCIIQIEAYMCYLFCHRLTSCRLSAHTFSFTEIVSNNHTAVKRDLCRYAIFIKICSLTAGSDFLLLFSVGCSPANYIDQVFPRSILLNPMRSLSYPLYK